MIRNLGAPTRARRSTIALLVILGGLSIAPFTAAMTAAIDDSIASGGSAEMPLPGQVQGAIFKKIFPYAEKLRGEIVVYLVGGDEQDETTQELLAAFRDERITPVFADLETLSEPLSASVVYLMPEADVELAREYCTQYGVLSISGVPSFVEQGGVSVGLDVDGRRPVIVVNLQRLAAEGHTMSSELLGLARVIR